MPDALLLPAHGPVSPSSHARIDELLQHHNLRLELSRTAVNDAGSTAHEVARILPWTRDERRLVDLDEFNAGLAVLESRAHLELLVHRGELGRTTENDVAIYTALNP